MITATGDYCFFFLFDLILFAFLDVAPLSDENGFSRKSQRAADALENPFLALTTILPRFVVFTRPLT